MTQKSEHFHGSDLEKIEEIYHIPKEEITSFSANVNPLGISPKLRETLTEHIDAITGYPERDYISLRRSIGQYIHTNTENIIVGNGSTELISLFIHRICPSNAMILGPSYSEYEHELHLTGAAIHYYQMREADGFKIDTKDLIAQLTPDIGLLIMCNPNNPTSTAITRDEMRIILETCKKNNTYVLVDETYVEFSDRYESITSIPLVNDYDNIIILRGISKFFAAPGLRLGYAVCSNHELLADAVSRQNPWSINTLACIAGEIMFTDETYIKQTKELISSERRRMCKDLEKLPNVRFYEADGNFILCHILKDGISSGDVFEAAIRQKLMIRNCSDFPFLGDKYFRFCIMSPEKNDELMQVIRSLLGD